MLFVGPIRARSLASLDFFLLFSAADRAGGLTQSDIVPPGGHSRLDPMLAGSCWHAVEARILNGPAPVERGMALMLVPG